MEKPCSLSDIIFDAVKKDAKFFDLEPYEQGKVLKHIRENNLDFKFFKRKWYDILTNKFYAEEFIPGDDYSFATRIEKISFDTFKEFYKYVKEDIYDHKSCFYGYDFSEEEIKKYSLQTSKLNFKSFTDDRINNHSLSEILTKYYAEEDKKLRRVTSIVNWFVQRGRIKTIRALENKQKEFLNAFDFRHSLEVFISFALRKNKYLIKDAAIQYASTHYELEGISFFDILMAYGEQAALKVIHNLSLLSSDSASAKRASNYNIILNAYKDGPVKLSRKLGYDSDLFLYYVYDKYLIGEKYSFEYRNYFESFKEFTLFVHKDLSSADFSKAPISRDIISKYRTNSDTKYPISTTYKTLRITKKYQDNYFLVKQEWLNEENTVIFSESYFFDIFFDFVYFLNSDLSNSDLLFCNGLENIKNLKDLKLENLKVRSKIADALELSYKKLPTNNFIKEVLTQTKKYVIEQVENDLTVHPEDEDKLGRISYITDIHLIHRFKHFNCRSINDVDYVSKSIAKKIAKESSGTVLIGGDTASNFDIFKNFIDDLALYKYRTHFFFTLGNHELWSFKNLSFQNIIQKYKDLFSEMRNRRFYLVQNNIFYCDEEWEEITEEELTKISPFDLRNKMRNARLIIFGGIGFAGTNEVFNANNGIYLNTLNREDEIKESQKFLTLYRKVISVLADKNLVIFTHMPIYDWGGKNIQAERGVVYINGHNHKNVFFDDGNKRIYADNQVGYNGKRISLKTIPFNFTYDWFVDYKDGIYEISKEDYQMFYLGLRKRIDFNSKFKNLYMLKKAKTYMFLMRGVNDSLVLLDGGSKKRVIDHPMSFFYDKIDSYSQAVNSFLSGYFGFQKQVSHEIKRIGGDGRIHGCIVDIDFFNHLYLNPFDGKITAYNAESMVHKYIYSNLQSLLKYQCPLLYKNYENLIKDKDKKNSLILFKTSELISEEKVYEDNTEMYKISSVIRRLQHADGYNIIRFWDDALIEHISAENGKFIVSCFVNPGLLPAPHFKKPKKPKSSRHPRTRIHVSDEERKKIIENKYISKIELETKGNITCLAYNGSHEKATYKCNNCGYEWSIRTDHFKDQQYGRCPKCNNADIKE